MVSLPPEIWDCIIQNCSVAELWRLLYVSQMISEIAESHLFRTVTCVDNPADRFVYYQPYSPDSVTDTDESDDENSDFLDLTQGILIGGSPDEYIPPDNESSTESTESEDEIQSPPRIPVHEVGPMADLVKLSNDLGVYWTDDVRYPSLDNTLSEEPGVCLRSLALACGHSLDFAQVLAGDRWRKHLRHAFFIWYSKSVPPAIRGAINDVSQLDSLQSLHLSLPSSTVALPFDTSRVTSITTSIPHSFLWRGREMLQLLAIFKLPLLRKLFFESMPRLVKKIPRKYHQPGCSNVRELTIVKCGFQMKKLQPVLSWPKNLQKFHMVPDVHPDSWDKYMNGGGWEELSDVLEPMKGSLRDIKYEDRFFEDPPIDGDGFRTFPQLTRLQITVDVLYNSDQESFREPVPLPSCLPPTLEELHLRLSNMPGFWSHRHVNEVDRGEDDGDHIIDDDDLEDEYVTDLFDWMSGLLHHRSDHFTHLRKVTLDYDYGGPEDCKPPRKCCFWYHKIIKHWQRLFADSGIVFEFVYIPHTNRTSHIKKIS